jgi:hypothetical protein
MTESSRRSFLTLGRSAVLALGILGGAAQASIVGCSKEAPAALEPDTQVAASRSPAAADSPAQPAPGAEPGVEQGEPSGPVPAADAKFTESSFDLEIKSKGNYTAGQSGVLEVVLDAKGPYKVNDKYPFKLKLEDTDGVQYPDKVVKKEAVKLEPKRAVMTVKFTPATKGKKRVAGQFAFSICTDERCLIERRDLALDVQVN